MAPSISITSTESLNIMDFVVNKGHGVKGLAELGLKALPNQYIQPPQERFDNSNEEPNQDSIPVIDMSNWDDPNVAKDICDAASKWGFFQIVNHGVPYHVLDDVKDATRKFFALPAEEKLKYSKEKSVTNSIRFGTSFTPEAEKALEWKDYLSLFFVSDDEAATLWPSVCRTQLGYDKEFSKLVVKKLLMILLNGLNVKEIDEAKESKLMGYVHVSPSLLQDEIGGLYVRNMDTMKWIHVPPVSGSLVINVGDALQIISNGKYKSVEHRVSANGSSNRISVPIFVNPRPSDVIGPLQELIDSGEKPLYKNVVYSDYVKHFFRKAHDGKATIDFAKV
ncbi:feruloyl CoA ortho-hydroxylase 1-like protein [Tanacetum coccineum]